MADPETTKPNPFAAPTVQKSERALSPDTEFLVSGTSILCEDDVSLPRICILTGQTNDLLKMTRNLRWAPQAISIMRFPVTLAGLPLLIRVFYDLLNGRLERSTEVEQLFLLSAMGFLAIAVPGIWLLTWMKTRTVKATFYINKRSAQITQISTWVMRAFLVAASGFVLYLIRQNNFETEILIIVVIIGVIFFRGQATPGMQPQFVGRHEELNVLVMRRPFVDRINEMIAAEDSAVAEVRYP